MKFNQERVYVGFDRPIRRGEVVNEVFKTDDHSIFKLSKFNRNVLFRKEMLEQVKLGIISPIIVNEEMVVIDGQNRLLHSEHADVPVEYIIKEGLTEDDIVRMNTIQKPWNLSNYIEAYANQGHEEYEKLFDLIEKKYSNVTNTIQFSLDYATSFGKGVDLVKNGDFSFWNYGKTMEFLKFSERFREETKTPKRSRFETALYTLFRYKNVDKNRIINKVIQVGIADEIKVKSATHTEALKMLLDAYNQKLSMNSKGFIKYHITSQGTIKIDRELQDWTRKED